MVGEQQRHAAALGDHVQNRLQTVAGEHHLRRKPGLPAGADTQIVRHGILFDEGKHLVGQLSQLKPGLPRQRVVPRQHRHQMVLPVGNFHHLGFLIRVVLKVDRAVPVKAQIAFAFQQPLPHLDGIRLLQLHLHGGKVQLKPHQNVGDVVMGNHRNGRQTKRFAAGLPVIEGGGLIFILQAGHLLGVGQHQAAEFRQGHPAGAAVKQRRTQLSFQRLDVLGQRGLPDEQTLRRGPVILCFRQHHKFTEVADFHGTSIPFRNRLYPEKELFVNLA